MQLSFDSKWRRLLAPILVLSLLLAACGGSSSDEADSGGDGGEAAANSCDIASMELVTAGKLTIATGEPAFPPYVVDDDPSNGQGFEAAIAYAIAGELGFADADVEWVRVGFDEAVAPGAKAFDFNLQQYTITAERDEVVDFSASYYDNEQAIVAASGSAAIGASSIDDLKGLRVGAAIGTTSLNYIEDVIQPDSAALVYDDNSAVNAAFLAGQLDAFVVDLPSAYYLTAVEFDDASIIGVLPRGEGEADQFGALFAEGNSLVGCVNTALESLRSAGTLDSIAGEWLSGGDIVSIKN